MSENAEQSDDFIATGDLDEHEDPVSIRITRDIYQELRDSGFYIGENSEGDRIRLTEDYTVVKESNSPEAWGAVFEVDNWDDGDGVDTVADHQSKKVMLRAEPKDTIEVTAVKTGGEAIPLKLDVVRRSNTYFGPKLLLTPHGETDEPDEYMLTCPGPDSYPVLRRAVTDDRGLVQRRVKVATVAVTIHNISGYDICEACGDPIKDPLHRSLALTGECPGGQNE